MVTIHKSFNEVSQIDHTVRLMMIFARFKRFDTVHFLEGFSNFVAESVVKICSNPQMSPVIIRRLQFSCWTEANWLLIQLFSPIIKEISFRGPYMADDHPSSSWLENLVSRMR